MTKEQWGQGHYLEAVLHLSMSIFALWLAGSVKVIEQDE